MLWLFFEIWTTSFDWKHATCPLVAGKFWPLIIVNIRNISIYIYKMIWRDMIWWDFSSFVSKHEHDQTCIAQLFKLKCKNRMQLNTITCVRASRTFCQQSLVQFSRNYVLRQGFVASPWKKSPQAPAVATKTYLPQHFLYCFFKPCLSTQKGRRASTARSQAVERTDKLPECVLSRCSKHANRPACRSLWVGSTWVGIEVTL